MGRRKVGSESREGVGGGGGGVVVGRAVTAVVWVRVDGGDCVGVVVMLTRFVVVWAIVVV